MKGREYLVMRTIYGSGNSGGSGGDLVFVIFSFFANGLKTLLQVYFVHDHGGGHVPLDVQCCASHIHEAVERQDHIGDKPVNLVRRKMSFFQYV